VDLARLQFAFTIVFHFIFIPHSLGLSVVTLFAAHRYYRTGLEEDKLASAFWITRLRDQRGLTLAGSTSSSTALTILLILTLMTVPPILGHQFWTHRLFRHKVQGHEAEY
jgi:cytochrome bd-type quinol oxidase subunit 2